MKKMFQFMLTSVALIMSLSMVSCNKTEEEESNNIPQAVPNELKFKWEGGEKDITIRPTKGTRMTKDWTFVEADNPKTAAHTTERMTVDTTSTPGVKKISNGWITMTVTDLGRQIHIKVFRNTTTSSRSIRFTGICEQNRFSITIHQNGISY